MSDDKDTDAMLMAMFKAARDEAPQPSADMMARVLAGAGAEAEQLSVTPQVRAPKRGMLANLFEALGGWPAMAGLSAATLAGIWIGVNPPAGLTDQVAGLLGAPDAAFVIDLDTGAGFEFLEGSS